MKRRFVRYCFVFLLLVSFCLPENNCMAGFNYDGEGVFTDYGLTASSDRYVLDLGKIDLSKINEKNIIIGDLPNDNTLGFYLYFKINGELDPNFWHRFTKIKIDIVISIIDTNIVVYKYNGVMFEDGISDGVYFRKGLLPVETTFMGYKTVGFTIPYYFDDKKTILGFKTPFYKNCKRKIFLKILDPGETNRKESESHSNTGLVADIIISGGDW